MIKRLFDKSIKSLKNEGINSLIKKIYVFLDRKIRPQKYFHKIKIPLNKKYLLFISGEPKNSTSFYRCEIPQEQLSLNNKDSDIIYYKYMSAEYIKMYDHIIWYRVPFEEWMKPILDEIKQQNKKIIFSIDDLLFDEESILSQDWIDDLYIEDRKRFLKQVADINKFMTLSDLGISSTDYLKSEMNKLIKGEILVHRNGIPEKYFKSENNDMWPGIFNIGFFSGSETHDSDSELIAEQVKVLLDEYKDLRLHIGGRVKVPDELLRYKQQVVIYPYLDFDDYLKVIQNCAFILIPLVINKHNECKSEVRAQQAGIMRRTVVATNTNAFKYLIINEKNGLLVNSKDNWYNSMKFLLDNEEKTKQMGQKLFDDIREKYDSRNLGKDLIDFLDKNDKF